LQDGRWRDTRDGSELFAALSRIISQQGGQGIVLKPE
jgi:CyaY protein